MAGTILDYIEEFGEYSFQDKPFNEVDSLILCQFSYLKFDGIVPLVTENKKSVTLQYIKAHADYEKLYADERFEKVNRALFTAMLACRRFKRLRLNCYINIVEPEWETQFSAVTFLLEKDELYLAYRGTDETLIGWKEDFNMAFLDPVPGQSFAVKYMNMVMDKLGQNFYVGGHSKGGNFAVYAALHCVQEQKKRILRVYNHDGPGFRPEVLKRFAYEEMEDKIVRILPHSSLVGMLLLSVECPFVVVECKSFGLLQHDPFTWLVEEDHFVKVKDIYRSRRFSDSTINDWILAQDEEQLKTFVDTLFQVISASEAETLIDFTADWKKSMNGVLAALKEVDDETKGIIIKIIKALFTMARERIKFELVSKRKG